MKSKAQINSQIRLLEGWKTKQKQIINEKDNIEYWILNHRINQLKWVLEDG